MGVPSFYRYLLNTFGRDIELKLFDRHLAHESIHSRYVEFNNARETGSSFYKDADLNANVPPVQFDNLYLDMNGLIHPCAHPESGPKPVDEQEMLFNVMMYLDRLVYAIRPTTLLYLSVDGCAPRAKMNQQRGRRFISAKESQISKMVHTQQLKHWTEKMKRFLNTEDDVNIKELYSELFEDKKPSWDHNVITPGTLFMEKITTILHFYAAYKINTDPLFKNLKVIVSDASNPGEGEHKILSYIRQQRNDPKYKSRTKHLIHALDADLIMLSLASHETQLYILRENNMNDKVHHLDRELLVVDIPTLKMRLCKEMVKQVCRIIMLLMFRLFPKRNHWRANSIMRH
jgi:5'-3' exoribonuclease 2